MKKLIQRKGSRVAAFAKLVGALGAVSLLGACGDDGTIVELRVIETVPVDFERMDGGVGEGASITLDDLRDEPAYVEARPSLKCGSVNQADSFIEIEALQVGAGATVLDYQVGVAPAGSQSFTPLATFSGSVTSGARVPLSAFNPAGLALVSQVTLSAAPALEVQVTATVPGALDQLQVALSLVIDFSSDAKGCP